MRPRLVGGWSLSPEGEGRGLLREPWMAREPGSLPGRAWLGPGPDELLGMGRRRPGARIGGGLAAYPQGPNRMEPSGSLSGGRLGGLAGGCLREDRGSGWSLRCA